MPPLAAKILRLHFCERDRWEGMPLYEAVIARCRELHIAGATVFRGVEGYGDSAEIHRDHLIGRDLPILVSIVDTPENIDRLVPALEAMMSTGMIAISAGEMIRVEKSRTPLGPGML